MLEKLQVPIINFTILLFILVLSSVDLHSKNFDFKLDKIIPQNTKSTEVNSKYDYFERQLISTDDLYKIQKLSNNEDKSKKDIEYLLSNCLYTTNQEISGLTTSELVAYLRSTQDYECISRILFSYESQYSPSIFSNEKIQAVANQLSVLAPWYNGTHANGIYGLILYLRVATYFDFYYKPDIELNQDSWDAINLATKKLADNQHIFDLNADAAEIITEYIILLDLPGIRSQTHSLSVMKEVMYRMAVTKNWKTVENINWVKGYWNIFFIMFRGSQDTAYLDSIAQDDDFIQLWGLVATDPEIKDEPQIKDLYQSNSILEMSRLATKPQFSDLLCPHLADVCALYDRLETNWLYAIIAINQAGKCQDYNLCEDVDGLSEELSDFLFPNQATYDDSKLIFNSKLNRTSSDLLYYATKQSQAQFYRLLQSDEPVPNDLNDTINCFVFASKNDYDNYAPFLFGISTNNGGMYIESRSEFYTWDRPSSYYLSLEELFRHEYVHYLQGRYMIPGLWGQADIYSNGRLTWYEEGGAELISGSTQNRGLKLKSSTYDRLKSEYPNCPTIDEVLHSNYSQASQIYYPYGHLLWFHWYYEDFQILRKFMDFTLSSDVQGFDDLVDSILTDTNFEAKWQTFLQKVNNDEYEVWDINTDWLNDDSITTRSLAIIKDEFESCTGLTNSVISVNADSLIARFILTGKVYSDRQVQNFSQAFRAINISMDSLITLMIGNSQINNFINTIGYFKNISIINGYPEAVFTFAGSLRNESVPEVYSVDFTSDKNVALTGSTVQFESLSDGYIKQYAWEFEGGNPSTSSDKNPAVLYNQPGLYRVSLLITGIQPDDTLSITKDLFVRIYEEPYLSEYCSATYGYDYAWISKVRINDLVTNSVGFPTLGYSDYSQDNIAEIFRDTANIFEVNVSYSNSPNVQIAVWIDVNQNGNFTDPDEQVYNSFIPQNSQLGLVNFELPETALTGSTRLRVRLNYRSTPILPCGYDSYAGEVEDYSVMIRDKGNLNYSRFDINLVQGWQIISSPTDPLSKNMEKIFLNNEDKVVLVKNGSGQTYIPMLDINQIGNWNFYEGYQVYCNQSAALNIAGFLSNPESSPMNLEQGWHIVSYLRNSPMSALTAFETLTDDDALVLAKNSAGHTYIPMLEINQIGNLQPGQGYQIYLSKNSNLTYPANSQNKLSSLEEPFPEPKVLIASNKLTGSSSTLLVFSETENGNEVGVYDEKDLLVGSGVFNNGIANVIIWGDNERTTGKDGALFNEKLRCAIYSTNSRKVSDIQLFDLFNLINNTTVSELTYKKDQLLTAKTITDDIFSVTSTFSVSPNPFTNEIKIDLDLTSNSEVSIKIYDLSGALVGTVLDNSKILSGTSQLSFNGQHLSNSEYLVVLTIDEEKFIQKLIRSN